MITAEFTRPTPPGGTVAGYILVYKGTIGVNGTTVIDPVDSNIAVIARRIAMDCDASAGEAIDANLFNGGAWIPEGSIVAVVDETARVTKQAGHYRRSYVSGHATVFTPRLCNNISSPCGNCSETDIYTTDTWSNGVLERQTRCPESCSSDNSPMTADASRVEQNTPRPIIDFDFNLAGRFGPLVAEIAVCDHNGPEKATQEGGTFDPGSITYSLQRLRFPQIDQSASIMVVKLKDFAAIAPSLLSFLTCQSCGNNSPFAAWDGTIPRDDFDPTGGYIGLDTNHNISLNQSGVSASVWTDSGRWGLEISCKTSGGSSVTLWQGFKTTGYTPTGTYGVDGNAGTRGCAADAISCITLE